MAFKTRKNYEKKAFTVFGRLVWDCTGFQISYSFKKQVCRDSPESLGKDRQIHLLLHLYRDHFTEVFSHERWPHLTRTESPNKQIERSDQQRTRCFAKHAHNVKGWKWGVQNLGQDTLRTLLEVSDRHCSVGEGARPISRCRKRNKKILRPSINIVHVED